MNSLEKAKAAGRPERSLKTLTHPALLVVDEIGYLPVTQSGAVDEVMAAALLDRLFHRCHIVNIRGNSYRMRCHAELSKGIRGTGTNPVSSTREAAS